MRARARRYGSEANALIVRLQIRVHSRRPVRSRGPAGSWAPALLALLVLAGAAGVVAVWQARVEAPPVGSLSDPASGYLERLFEQRARTASRLVYPYSVIPGGVAAAEEVLEAARRDPVVARHYAGFDPRRARTVTLRQPRLAYVSYRVKDKVYFTKKPVRLFEGEQVITDGKTTIRARCGNKVEEAPQMAVSAEEPPEDVLNTPKLEAEPERGAPALGAPGLAAPKPEEEAPLAAVVPPAGFMPLDMPPRGPGGIWLTPPPAGGGFLPPVGAPGPGGTLPPPPPAGPGTEPGTPPPPPSTPPPETPPATPPGTTPPGTPPVTPPGPAPEPPPVTPPTTPPSAPPGTPPSPPVSPPPAGPPSTPPVAVPPAAQPPTGGDVPPPGPQPPPGVDVPPPGPLPPPVLPPAPEDPETPGSLPPPEVVIPPPGGAPPPEIPEPPPIPEPSTYGLMGLGLLSFAVLRARAANRSRQRQPEFDAR